MSSAILQLRARDCAHRLRLERLLDECVMWTTGGTRLFGVVSSVNANVGIVAVKTGQGLQFVRVDQLQPFWGAWSR
mgnify:FL=1